MSAQRLIHFQKWLGHCARQYCLTKPWDATLSPWRLAGFFSTLELLIEEKDDDMGRIAPGHKVTLFDTQVKEKVTFVLVHPDDSDPENAKLSFLSPLGSRLVGRTLGDVVEIQIFGRKEAFHVIGIEH